MINPPSFLCKTPVKIEPYLGNGAYGPQYDSPINTKAYVEQTRNVVKNENGDEVVSETFMIIKENIDIPNKSKITIDDNVETFVIKTSPQKPMDKFADIEVYLE